MKRLSLQTMIEVAIFAAIALVLDILPSLKLGPALSVSFAMVPIFLVSFRWGALAGMTSGFLWGLLQVFMGDVYILTPVQAFIEYFIAFACVGLAGIVKPFIQSAIRDNRKGKFITWLILGIFIGSVARYFWHFIAGVIFFGQYAKPGQTAVMYSLIVNGSTMFFTFLLCTVVLCFLTIGRPSLLKVRQEARDNRKKITDRQETKMDR